MAIGVIIIVIAVFSYANQNQLKPLALLQRSIWIPQYWSGECVPRADNKYELQITSHTDNPTWYHCTTQESGKWIPVYPGVQCEYIVDTNEFKSIYTCDGITSNNADLSTNKCSKQSGIFLSTSKNSFVIDAGDSIYINTNQAFGNAKLYAKYPSYGIKIHQADGLITATTTNCLLNSINANDKGVVDLHTVGQKDRVEIKPDIPFNVVSGLRPAISTQSVSLNDVENGYPIYITRPGFYNLIKKADDGFEYADTAQEFRSARIECIPRTAGCNDEARIVKIEQQSCDKFGGSIVGYAPVQGDSTRLCKYACLNGVLKAQNDCIEIPQGCPSDKPLFDANTGRCVTLSEQTLTKPVCASCFGWMWNKVTGNKYCTPQPAKKILGIIPVPATSQNSVCPWFLLILVVLLGGGGYWAYTKFKKKGKRK